jgi:hypothetical protein
MATLSHQENATGFTHALRISYKDLQTSGYLTSGERLLVNIPAGGIVTNAAVVVNTAAAGANDISLSVGITSGTATNFIYNVAGAAAIDLDGLTKTNFNSGSALDTEPGYVNNTTSAVPVYAKFGGTIANLTAGDWTIALTILDPGALGNPV